MKTGRATVWLAAMASLLFVRLATADAGRTPGTFDVASSGGATYTIPIWRPPGPGGIDPDISLNYNSQAGRGVMGVGWILAGLSSIERCWPTKGQDGAVGAVTFGTVDKFCLNGNRLRLTSGATYGAANSTYQTEFADFTEVTFLGPIMGGGPSSFTAKGKNGLKYEFGGTPDSQVTVGTSSIVLRWKVNKVSDRFGNNYVVVYSKENASGYANPSVIRWTRNSSSATGATDYTYSMHFAYSLRNAWDAPFAFMYGQPAQNLNRLDRITVKSTGSGTEKTVRRYQLTYGLGPPARYSLLTSLKECADDTEDHCLAPTTFDYQSAGAGVTANSALVSTPGAPTIQGAGDFNGDGREDVAYTIGNTWRVVFGGPSGFAYTSVVTGLSAAANAVEIDRFLPNGRDAILANVGGTLTTFVASDANGDGVWEFTGGVSTGFTFAAGTVPTGVDYNGDGLSDMEWIAVVSGQRRVQLRQNTSTNSSANPSFSASLGSGHSIPTSTGTGGTVQGASLSSGRGTFRMDANGDGREDVYIALSVSFGSAGTTYQAVSRNGLSLAPFINWQASALAPQQIGNFNDDRCTDIRSTAGAFVQSSTCDFPFGPSTALPAGVTVKGWMDWDGDGRVDLLTNNAGTIGIYLSTGSGFMTLRTTAIPATPNYGVSDIDGDSLMDLYTVDGNAVRYYTQAGAGLNPTYLTHIPDLLASVTDGYGVTFGADYQSTGDISFSRGTLTASPLQETAPFIVAKRARLQDGAGGNFTKTYTYIGAREDADRSSFVGFQQINMVDSRGGFVTRTYYDQTFPRTGMVYKRESYQANGNLVSRSTFTNTPQELDATPNNQRYFQHVAAELTETNVVSATSSRDGQPLTTVSVTNSELNAQLGNIGKVTTTVTDTDAASPDSGQSWTTAVTYSYAAPNTTSRCLDLLSSTRTEYSTGSNPPSLTRNVSYVPDTAICQATTERVEEGSSTLRVDTTYGYDAFGNVRTRSVVGRRSDGTLMPARNSSMEWGPRGLAPVLSTDALNQTTSFDYNYDLGQLKNTIDPNGLTTSIDYDEFGRLKKFTRPGGTAMTWDYTWCSPACLNDLHKLTVTVTERKANGNALRDSITYLDQLDRSLVSRVKLMDGTYQWTERQFDARGKVVKSSLPCSTSGAVPSCVTKWAEFGYDDVGRTLSVTQPVKTAGSATKVTTFVHDGRKVTQTDPQNRVSNQTYNVDGELRRAVDLNGYRLDFGYDLVGSLVAVTGTDPQTLATRPLYAASYNYGIGDFQTSATDPASGTRNQFYNSLGELTSWTDAKGQPFSARYDDLSRIIERTEPDNVSSWKWGSDPTAHNVGKLESTGFLPAGGYAENFSYDSLGRLSQQSFVIPGHGTFNYNFTYDGNTGVLDTFTYPQTISGSRLALRHNYSAAGFLQSIADLNGSPTYWTANAVNARGDVVRETFGNGIVRERFVDTVSGFLDKIQAGTLVNPTSVQNSSYLYDLVGNVTQRINGNTGLTEDFFYGGTGDLYRLTSSTLKSGSSPAVPNLSVAYDPIGNILSKNEPLIVGDPMIPHTVTWNSANYPTQIRGTSSAETATFAYAPDRRRWKMEFTSSGNLETTYNIGGMLEKVEGPGGTDYRHYIQVGGDTIAILSRRATGDTLRYVLSDHQDSIDSILNPAGTSTSESFTAFGERRNAATWTGLPGTADRDTMDGVTRQGYTFQTGLGSLGMNHMNGRVQDAVTGRFLSPDPYVTDQGSSQDYNRYAYVNNNPLTLTDPSGFGWVYPGTTPGGASPLPDTGQGEHRDPDWDMYDPYEGWRRGWWGYGPTPSSAPCATAAGGFSTEFVRDFLNCGGVNSLGLGDAIAQSEAARHTHPDFYGSAVDPTVATATTTADEGPEVEEYRAASAPLVNAAQTVAVVGEVVAENGAEVAAEILLYKGRGKLGKDLLGTGGKAAAKKGAAKAAAKKAAGECHHIATNKCVVKDWTRNFTAMFKKANMTLEDPLNKIVLVNHKGPHNDKYHQYVMDRLTKAVGTLSGTEYRLALRNELQKLRTELGRPNSAISRLLALPP